MKKNEIKELAKLSMGELKSKLAQLSADYYLVANKLVSKDEKNVHAMRVIEKNIARVLTVVRQKELGI